MSDPVLEEVSPETDTYEALLAELRAFTRGAVGVLDNLDYALVIRDLSRGPILGGLWGQSRWGGFHIDILVVSEPLRRQGWGSRLLRAAEAEARRRNCQHLWLDTYEFQARRFYERHGFEAFGQLDGPAPFYPRYFMRKLLAW